MIAWLASGLGGWTHRLELTPGWVGSPADIEADQPGPMRLECCQACLDAGEGVGPGELPVVVLGVALLDHVSVEGDVGVDPDVPDRGEDRVDLLCDRVWLAGEGLDGLQTAGAGLVPLAAVPGDRLVVQGQVAAEPDVGVGERGVGSRHGVADVVAPSLTADHAVRAGAVVGVHAATPCMLTGLAAGLGSWRSRPSGGLGLLM